MMHLHFGFMNTKKALYLIERIKIKMEVIEDFSHKKILVLGGTGFIGRHVVQSLLKREITVGLVTRRDNQRSKDNLKIFKGNIFDLVAIRNVVDSFRPNFVVHLAWDVSEGFWEASVNSRWSEASAAFFDLLSKHYVEKITIAGSCAELDIVSNKIPIHKDSNLQTAYAIAKTKVWRDLKSFGNRNGIKVANGKIFFPIGIGEPKYKLVTSVTHKLIRNEPIEISNPFKLHDYVDVRDVGEAMAALSISKVDGEIDIGNGKLIPVKKLVDLVLKSFKNEKKELVNFSGQKLAKNILLERSADRNRLEKDLNFYNKIPVEKSVREITEHIQNSFN